MKPLEKIPTFVHKIQILKILVKTNLLKLFNNSRQEDKNDKKAFKKKSLKQNQFVTNRTNEIFYSFMYIFPNSKYLSQENNQLYFHLFIIYLSFKNDFCP